MPRHKLKPIFDKNSENIEEQVVDKCNKCTTIKKRGRPKKINVYSMIISIILVFFVLNINGEVIQGKFKYCNTDESMLKYVSSNINCSNTNTKLFKTHKAWFSILSKNHDQINGIGIECIKLKNTAKYYENFFGNQFESNYNEIVQLTRAECNQMYRDKTCNNNIMICNGDNCFFKPKRSPLYSWLTTNELIDYSCFVNIKLITSANETSRLFNTKCTAMDLECSLDDRIIIWNQDIIHKCPFKQIALYEFNIHDNILINDQNNLLFQLIKEEKHCDLNMYSTKEGIYIMSHISMELDKKIFQDASIKIDNNALISLQLADEDYEFYKNVKAINRLEKDNCLALISTLKNFESSGNKFLYIMDEESREVVLYNYKSSVTIPSCVNVDQIEPVNSRYCYKDIPVMIKLNNINTTVFLNEQKILIKTSNIIECDNKTKSIYLNDNDMELSYKNNLVQITKIKRLKFDLQSKTISTELNFQHSPLLLDVIDNIGNFLKVDAIEDKQNVVFIEKDIDQLTSKQSFKYPYLIVCVVVGSAISGLIILIYFMIKNRWLKLENLHMKYKTNKVEMNKLDLIYNYKTNTVEEPLVNTSINKSAPANEEHLYEMDSAILRIIS